MKSVNEKKNLGKEECYLLVDLLEIRSTIYIEFLMQYTGLTILCEHGQRARASYAQNHMNKNIT